LLSSGIEKIDEKVFRLSVPEPRNLATNVYLLVCKTPTIIDTGHSSRESVQSLAKLLNDVGYNLSQIKNVIFTHPHIDHMGGAVRFPERDKIRYISLEGAIRDPDDFNGYVLKARDILKSIQKKCKKAGIVEQNRDLDNFLDEYYSPTGKITMDKTVVDGELMHIDDFTLKIIHTPGHNPFHICLLDIDRKWLYSGDMIADKGPLFISGMGYNIGHYIKSLSEVKTIAKDTPLKKILPGHGNVYCDPKEAIASSRKMIEDIEKNLIADLSERPATVFDIAQSMVKNIPKTPEVLEFSAAIVDTFIKFLIREKKVKSISRDGSKYFVAEKNA
jgi:glyoxylase-like metal-dependent hydrolase (beta-lactamase superfamily II)